MYSPVSTKMGLKGKMYSPMSTKMLRKVNVYSPVSTKMPKAGKCTHRRVQTLGRVVLLGVKLGGWVLIYIIYIIIIY